MTEIRIDGLEELRQVLTRTLPQRLQGKAMQAALAKAARPIVQAARAGAPVKTGRLRRAIYSARSKFNQSPTYASRVIGVRRGKKQQKNDRDAFYWKWNEFGRAEIVAGQITRNRSGRPGGARTYQRDTAVLGTPQTGFLGKRVRAVPARPFLRPAFEANKFRALRIFQDSMKAEIEKVAARERRRTFRRVVGF